LSEVSNAEKEDVSGPIKGIYSWWQ